MRMLALHGTEMYLKVCTVDARHDDTRTVDVTPIDEGAPILGVNLQADQNLQTGFVPFPTEGSEVLVGFLSQAVGAVLLTTQIDKALLTIEGSEIWVDKDKLSIDINGTTLVMEKDLSTWNGGSETTANATDLKNQLTKVTARIDAIIQAISSSPVSPMDGGATYKAAMTASLAALQKEDYSNIIDDKIKH